MQNLLKNKKLLNLFLVVNSILYVLSFPPVNIPFLGVATIIVFSLIFAQANSIWEILKQSLYSSFVISAFGVYWIVFASGYVFHSNILSILILFGFALLYTCFFIPVSLLIYKGSKKGWKFIFIVFVAWVFSDALKYKFLGGFPWFLSGYMWLFNLKIIQLSSIIGVLGLSILTYLCVALILGLLSKDITKLHKIMIIATLVIIVVGTYVYGELRIHKFKQIKATKVIPIRLVQTNVAQADKMVFFQDDYNFSKIITTAFIGHKDKQKRIIILPEVAFNFFLDNNNTFKILKNNIPKNSSLLLGALRSDSKGLYNSFYIINGKTKAVEGFYDKVRLVPFGEEVPFGKYFPFIVSFTGIANFQSGNDYKILKVDEFTFMPLICFEGLFPLQKVNFQDIDFILNIANEGWFDDSVELQQNWEFFRFRSIETGVPSIKLANTGISGVINAVGQVEFQMDKFVLQAQDVNVQVKKIDTFFSKINLDFIVFFISFVYTISLILCFHGILKKRE